MNQRVQFEAEVMLRTGLPVSKLDQCHVEVWWHYWQAAQAAAVPEGWQVAQGQHLRGTLLERGHAS